MMNPTAHMILSLGHNKKPTIDARIVTVYLLLGIYLIFRFNRIDLLGLTNEQIWIKVSLLILPLFVFVINTCNTVSIKLSKKWEISPFGPWIQAAMSNHINFLVFDLFVIVCMCVVDWLSIVFCFCVRMLYLCLSTSNSHFLFLNCISRFLFFNALKHSITNDQNAPESYGYFKQTQTNRCDLPRARARIQGITEPPTNLQMK